jgi:hypothetical protein
MIKAVSALVSPIGRMRWTKQSLFRDLHTLISSLAIFQYLHPQPLTPTQMRGAGGHMNWVIRKKNGRGAGARDLLLR